MSTATATRWYDRGLAFGCKGCGHCCSGPGGYVWVTEGEIKALAKALEMTAADFGKRYVRQAGLRLALVDGPGGDCVFLNDHKHCKLYAARPLQCRTYPWWPELVRSRKAWNAEKRHCPGIGTGVTHAARVIQGAVERTSAQDEESS